MTINWVKNQDGNLYKLDELNLSSNHFDYMTGVYAICHGGNTPRTVRVGQGFIRDRLQAHRQDQTVQYYANLGLHVTWASVPKNVLDGVEAFLAQNLDPILGERFPNVLPIAVNLPW